MRLANVTATALLLGAGTAGATPTNCDFEWGALTGWVTSAGNSGSGSGGTAQAVIRYVGGGCSSGSLAYAPFTSNQLAKVYGGCYSAEVYSGDGCGNLLSNQEYYLSNSFVVPGCATICYQGACVVSGSSKVNGGGCVEFAVLVNGSPVCSAIYLPGSSGLLTGGTSLMCGQHTVQWYYLPWTQFCCNLAGVAGQTATVRVHAICSNSDFTPAYGYLDDACVLATCTVTPLLSPTRTSTPTATRSATDSSSATRTATGSATPTETATATPSGSATETWTISETGTITETFTISPTHTESRTPTESGTTTESFTITETSTPSGTSSATASATPTGTASDSPTVTPTRTPSTTASVTGTPTDSPTASATVLPAPPWFFVGANTFDPGVGGPLAIEFVLPPGRGGNVKLLLYDSAGELVKTFLDGEAQAMALFRYAWDGRNDWGTPVASGVYLLRLKSTQQFASKKIAVTR